MAPVVGRQELDPAVVVERCLPVVVVRPERCRRLMECQPAQERRQWTGEVVESDRKNFDNR